MAVFGGMTLTNKGLALQGKAQAGTQLNYTRIAVGDGSLSGQSIPALNGLISPKKTLPIKRLRTQSPNKVIVGAVLSNAEVTTGFYFREVGVFAQDPDAGEILYAYANSGVTADYIAPGGGTDIIEKVFDCIVVVGAATNITATIDNSLVFARESDVNAKFDLFTGHKHTGAAGDAPKITSAGLADSSVGTAQLGAKAVTQAKIGDKAVGTVQLADGAATDTVTGNRTLSDATAPTTETGSITSLFSGLANMIKQTTGGATWRTLPGMTIAAIKALLDAATNAATASTLIKRDASGRAQVAAPSAAADIARKDTVDAAISTAATDASSKASAAQAAAIAAAATDATTKANAAQAAAISAAASDASTKANAVETNLTAHIGSGGTAHADVTTTTDGFMIAADKVKLNGIAAGANAYVHPNHTGDVTSSGDGVTAIAPGVIVDADVNSAAAISWSKINKTGSSLADLGTKSAADLTSGTLPAARLPAVSGDITMAAGTGTAAITAGAIVDADINSAAAISWAKVNSTAAIADVDVAAAAAIGWNKVSKTGASLADLPTRSAGDLSSGTLPAARLPAISGDITMAAGTGTAAITAGAIVNADVNATAAIDASKIGTGVVSNTEFGYLDGVTSGIQGQLDAALSKTGGTMTGDIIMSTASVANSWSKVLKYQYRDSANVPRDRTLAVNTVGKLMFSVPGVQDNPVVLETNGDITYYVRTDGNDNNTGLTNTVAGAFKTITKAVSLIPKAVNHTVVVNVAVGTYTEVVEFRGFYGTGQIKLVGDVSPSTSRNIHSLVMYGNTCYVDATGFNCLTPGNTTAVTVTCCIGAQVNAFNSTVASSGNGIDINLSNIRATGCNFSNKFAGVSAVNASVAYIENFSGSGNTWGNRGTLGSCVTAAGTRLTGTAGDSSDNGLLTYGGVLNPWGDNTTFSRSAVRTIITSGHTLAANTFTKLQFNTIVNDMLGEYSTSTFRFTAKKAGWYLISGAVANAASPAGTHITLAAYLNGNRQLDLGSYANSGTAGALYVQGATHAFLAAGDYVELYAYADGISMTTSTGSPLSNFGVTQIA
ncbi:hypothetical protein [Paenibacillus pedocola]|uniref:hypothetical protein n=1 Tax=Paenibacillus pedocola TaxID=3242193 RepID=UPI0028779778|nr:hypothetical protein [Paenibacillus typhae]